MRSRLLLLSFVIVFAACSRSHSEPAETGGKPTAVEKQAPDHPDQPAAPAPRVGEVTAVTGDVTVTTPADQTPRAVTVGMAISRDMTIKTGAGASIDVRFDNHAMWSLGENKTRPIAELAAIIDAQAVAVSDDPPPEDVPADDPDRDRTASAGRHAEKTAAETPSNLAHHHAADDTQARPPTLPDDKPQGCDEVECAINPDQPCCKKYTKSKAPPSDSPPAIPDQPSRDEIVTGLHTAKARVGACFQKYPTAKIVKVTITVAPSGSVSSAHAVDEQAGSDIGKCLEAAVTAAKFPRSQHGVTFKYPFTKSF
jgi:hypothetical protein